MKRLKTDWGDGPWQQEPDEKRWTDANTGLPCFIMRGPMGSWCGYVGVPQLHPAHGKSYYDSDLDIDDILTDPNIKERARIQKAINEIHVHGGLTYAGSDEKRGKDFHWFGFDCAHAGDYSPSLDRLTDPVLGLGKPTGWGDVITYRDLAFVEAECASLAKQLAAIDDDKFTKATRAVSKS